MLSSTLLQHFTVLSLFHRELVENKESQLVQSPNSSYHHLGGQVKCSNLMKNRYGACAGKASDWIATLCHSRSSFSTCATQRCRRGVRGSSRTSFHRRGNVWMGGLGGWGGEGCSCLSPPTTTVNPPAWSGSKTLRLWASAQTFHCPFRLSKSSLSFVGCGAISQKHLPSLCIERRREQIMLNSNNSHIITSVLFQT